LSLKENVELVKEELSSEEKFFEKAVVTEKFLKKYKKSIIAGVTVVILVAVANLVYDMQEKNRIENANAQLAILMKNPNDTQAQEKLKKESAKLYELWSFSKALTSNDTQKLAQIKKKPLPVVSDVAAYEVAQSQQKQEELESYSMRQNALYKDLAILQSALIYLQNNEIKKAKEKLALIDEKSSVKNVAQALEHYGVE
jgi:hypothetical protein